MAKHNREFNKCQALLIQTESFHRTFASNFTDPMIKYIITKRGRNLPCSQSVVICLGWSLS